MDHLYCDYDENLSHNDFFRKLQSDHKIIIDTAPLENWVICIPRAATITSDQLANPDFLLAHVLVPHDELPQSHFTNLLGIDIRLEQKRLTSVNAAATASSPQRSAPNGCRKAAEGASKEDDGRSSSSSSGSSSGIGADYIHNGDETTTADSSKDSRLSGPIESYVLFEEVFYTMQLMKYKVWCIDSALLPAATMRNGGGDPENTAGTSAENGHVGKPVGIYVVRNAKDAVDIIWRETRSNALFRRIDQACALFQERPSVLAATKPVSTDATAVDSVEPLDDLHAATAALYDRCLCILMQHRQLKEKCRQDAHFYRIVRIALETYMMNVVYERVFDGVGLAHREDGETFNWMARSLVDCNAAFFGVNAMHLDVAASIRSEMLRMEEYSTAIEKLGTLLCCIHFRSKHHVLCFCFVSACLRRSMNATGRTLSVDDLIPIFAFVIVKSGLTHWPATQHFLQRFVFNELIDTNEKSADSFLAATLEAAITYIIGLGENKRNKSTTDTICTIRPERRSMFAKQTEFIEYVFDTVRAGDESEVLRLFGGNGIRITVDGNRAADENNGDDATVNDTPPDTETTVIRIAETAEDAEQLCHPLCVCPRCAAISKARQLNVNTQNAHGACAIHIAAACGLPKMINVLLALGADVAVCDEHGWTALHYAAHAGQQSAVLLLLHAGVDVNARSADDLCTALHLASHNGHVGCVKAILYAAEQRHIRVEKNCLNRAGDTAVHLAARWGFVGIVETLLEYGVKVDIPNRKGRTASESAHNSLVREQLLNTFVIIDGSEWDVVDTELAPAAERSLEAPFRGCISEQMMLSDGGLGRRAAENDKVIAAIRNGDIKLAFYFLGAHCDEDGKDNNDENRDDDDEVRANIDRAASSKLGQKSACHPLCICTKFNIAKASVSRRDGAGTARMSPPAMLPNVNGYNADGVTMLQAAASRPGNARLVSFLIDRGASLKLRTPTLQSALHLAVQSGDAANVEPLLSVAGEYELNVQDADGNTALHLAVISGNAAMVDLLLQHEPWLDARNNEQQTVLDIARAGFMFNIVRLVEEAAMNGTGPA